MENVPHIVSLVTAPWCNWTMLVLLLFAALSEWLQPGVITQSYESLKVHTDRVYKDAPTSIMAQILITLFRIGIVAMTLCLWLCPDQELSFTAYILVCSVVFGLLSMKMLFNVLIDYTFQFSRQYGDAYEHYSNIFTLVSAALYPLTLVFLHVGSSSAAKWLMLCTAALFLLLWIYRSVHQFVRKPIALLYLLAYLLTLDVLPMTGMVLLSAKLISVI